MSQDLTPVTCILWFAHHHADAFIYGWASETCFLSWFCL